VPVTASLPTRLLWPVAAALATGAAALGLADGAAEHGDLSVYDPEVTAALVRARSGTLTALAQGWTFAGSEVSVGLLAALVAAWLLVRRRDRRATALFTFGMLLSGGLTLGLKHLLSRPRPPAGVVLGPLDTGYSFPSGHTLYSTAFLGLLAVLLWRRTTTAVARLGIVAGAVTASAAVALSRVYLGYHWLTDVLAGLALGAMVVAVTIALDALTRSIGGEHHAGTSG
jgi:membrane-associated phospholipid phosphatase